jgi:hypothetical protein
LVDGLPQKDDGRERDEAKQRPRQKIEAIGQVVLKPDVDRMEVFLHNGRFATG